MKFLSLAVILVSTSAASAWADVVMDQENVAPGGLGHILDYVDDYDAQTFTVRNTGQLTSVGLQLSFRWEQIRKPVTDNLHFKLTQTNAVGEPVVENVLATYDISPFDLTTTDYYGLPMISLNLGDQHVQVQSGDRLALVIFTNYTYMTHSEHQYYDWEVNNRDSIPGGADYHYAPKVYGPGWTTRVIINSDETWDFGYRITIDTVPEPSTILLAASGAAILFRRTRRGR
jgi:hypothetical protein